MGKIYLPALSGQHWNLGNKSVKWLRFPDGELSLHLTKTLTGVPVLILGSTSPPADHLLSLLFIVRAALDRGASRITAFIPYFGYSRSDHDTTGGEYAAIKSLAHLFNHLHHTRFRLVIMDPHSSHFSSLFTIPTRQLSAVALLARSFSSRRRSAVTVIAPDEGAAVLANKFARLISAPSAIILSKHRLSGSQVTINGLPQALSGSIVIVDDMVSSGATIMTAVKLLNHHGVKKIVVIAPHMVYSAGGWKKLARSSLISEVITTDSIAPPAHLPQKFTLVSLLPLIKSLKP